MAQLAVISGSILIAFAASTSWAQRHQSLREQCRAEISGAYIDEVDQLQLQQKYLTAVTKTNGDLHKAIAETERKIATFNGPTHSIDEQRQREPVYQKLEQLRELLTQNKQNIHESEAKIKASQLQIAKMDAAIAKIFVIEKLNVDSNPNFPKKLEFKEQCSNYQADCRLSNTATFELGNLLKLLPNKSRSCQQYITYSKSP